MSKITEIIPLNTPIELSVYWQILGTDCKHYFQVNEPGDGPYFKLGDEVVCLTYADTEKQVKAARREALEWCRDIVIGIDLVQTQQEALNTILNRLEDSP